MGSGALVPLGVAAVLSRCGSLSKMGRGTLILNSSLGCGRWLAVGCGCRLVSVWVAVKCGSGHTHFKLKSWVWPLACVGVRVPSRVGVGRCEVWVGAHSL